MAPRLKFVPQKPPNVPPQTPPEAAPATLQSAALWNANHFSGGMYDSEHVILSFRRLGEEKTEHYLNKMAVNWTRLEEERRARGVAGTLCHCEILIQTSPNVWYAYSINKMTGTYDPEAKKIIDLKPGVVHRKLVDNMHQYAHCAMQIPRKKQAQLFRFLERQVNKKFNFWGYVFSILPGLSWGVRNGSWLEDYGSCVKCWFCSELIVAALQYARVDGFGAEVPASPNSVWRACSKLFGFRGAANPVTMRSLALD